MKGPSNYQTGSSLGGIGDINGDSFDDVLIGCGRSSGGFAVVIFGMKGPFTNVVVTTNWPSSSVGFRIVGPAGDYYFPQTPRTARVSGMLTVMASTILLSGALFTTPILTKPEVELCG